jgi:hypothetical protein
MAIKYCTDYANDPNKPPCCDSCHYYHDARAIDLLEIYDERDVLTHVVCCAVSNWLEDKDV